tara:strand:+ start:538 stop:1134 length:597 start_codon:yes stop_codon:yes gene_type:complete
MSIGFAATTQTSDSVIKSYFKQKRKNRFDCISSIRANYEQRCYKFLDEEKPSLDTILNPSYILPEYDAKYRESRPGIFNVLYVKRGLWSVLIQYINNENWTGTTFSINCNVGNTYTHHPESIKRFIVGNYGIDAYKEWKRLVLDDIDSLNFCIKLARAGLKKVITSETCCESSTRLCKKVGLPVRQGYAFLLPATIKI